MKYGVLYNATNTNIGDDIQAYATARFLPKIDYFIDRERIDQFIGDGQPVAVIMNAWYMWAKWHWPPASCILPKFVGFHYADHQLSKQPGSPVKYEFLNGLGGEYLKTWSPVGCRDMYTLNQLQHLGIPAYFSGCITMTLPNMPEREDKGTYICLVDLDRQVVDRIKEQLKDEEIEIRVITHTRERDPNLSWDKRKEIVEGLLTEYQNARCVITKKLHCSLPCLALGTPVLLIKEMENDIRFDPYYGYLHRVTTTKFMKDGCDYDFLNPPANKPDYLLVRERLIQEVERFVEETQSGNVEVQQLPYSKQELISWRHDVMQGEMDHWLLLYRALQKDMKKKSKEIQVLKNKNKQLEGKVAAKRQPLWKRVARKLKRIFMRK